MTTETVHAMATVSSEGQEDRLHLMYDEHDSRYRWYVVNDRYGAGTLEDTEVSGIDIESATRAASDAWSGIIEFDA